jgi:DNA-binding NarL/FixJ family response regulator
LQILLVDDHALMHEVLGAVVRSAFPGARVTVASDLAAGLDAARRNAKFGLALLDLGLPGYAGIESLRRFRTDFPQLPVVVISSEDGGATVREALRAGAAGYIPKTTAPRLMAAALRVVAAGGVYVPREALDGIEPVSEAKKRSPA